MTEVRYTDYRDGTIRKTTLNDTTIIQLREDFDNGMNKKFVTFSDYVEAVVAYNAMLS